MSPPLFTLLRGSSGFEKKNNPDSPSASGSTWVGLWWLMSNSVAASLPFYRTCKCERLEAGCWCCVIDSYCYRCSCEPWAYSGIYRLQATSFDAPWLAWRIWICAVMLYATVWFMKYSLCNIPWTVWIVMLSHGTPFSERCIYIYSCFLCIWCPVFCITWLPSAGEIIQLEALYVFKSYNASGWKEKTVTFYFKSPCLAFISNIWMVCNTL